MYKYYKFREEIYYELEKKLKFLRNEEIKFENTLLDMKIETENIIRNDLEIKFRKNIINILKDLKTNSTRKGQVEGYIKKCNDYRWIQN